MCLNLTSSGVIDGCGADASWQDGSTQASGWGIDLETAAEWNKGHKNMMRNTTALLQDGILVGKEAYEVGDYVNAALCESCPATNGTIQLLQNLTLTSKRLGKRLIYECHGKGVLDEVAAFLIGFGKYHYYGFGGWNNGMSASNHWMNGIFDKPLGVPEEPTYNHTSKVWTRVFKTGTKVTFDLNSNKGKIEWAAVI